MSKPIIILTRNTAAIKNEKPAIRLPRVLSNFPDGPIAMGAPGLGVESDEVTPEELDLETRRLWCQVGFPAADPRVRA